jgi:uncharacterized protein YjiS (DUF1127 family)
MTGLKLQTAIDATLLDTAQTPPRSGLWSKCLSRLLRAIRTRRDQRQARAAFQHMLKVDAALLEDIGVTRDEVQWAAALPLCRNAALELRKVSGKRRNTH